MAHQHAKWATSTKKGPGRYQSPGLKAPSRKTPKAGAPSGFVQHTNPVKHARREHIALIGRRQFLKFAKAENRTLKAIVA